MRSTKYRTEGCSVWCCDGCEFRDTLTGVQVHTYIYNKKGLDTQDNRTTKHLNCIYVEIYIYILCSISIYIYTKYIYIYVYIYMYEPTRINLGAIGALGFEDRAQDFGARSLTSEGVQVYIYIYVYTYVCNKLRPLDSHGNI